MSRKFNHPNMTNFTCPVCKTAEDKPVILVAIPGTEDGNIVEAQQFHFDCAHVVAAAYVQALEGES